MALKPSLSIMTRVPEFRRSIVYIGIVVAALSAAPPICELGYCVTAIYS
jgi:hypothetical protein